MEIKHGFAFRGEFIQDNGRGDILLTPGNFAIGGGFKGDKFKYYEGPIPDGYILEQNELVVSMTDLSKQSDTLGYPARVPPTHRGKRFLHNQRLGKISIRVPERLDSGFLYYLLCCADYRNEVLASATGTTVKHTSPERIGRFEFALPPMTEQRAVAGILSALDEQIAINRRMSETLEAMARALFKSWFVDFDPARAKAEGSETGLPEHLDSLFPESFVEFGGGGVPKGWSWSTVDNVAAIASGRVNPQAYPDVMFSHHSIPAYDNGLSAVREEGAAIKSQKSVAPMDSVLLSKLNPEIERVWLVDVQPGERAVCSTEFLVMQPLKHFSRAYLYCFLRSPVFRTGIESLVTGTSKSHQRAHAKSILELPAVLPPEPVVRAFDRIAEPLLNRVLVARRESRTLAALRDTLLPKLISGELRVKDAERFLAGAGV